VRIAEDIIGFILESSAWVVYGPGVVFQALYSVANSGSKKSSGSEVFRGKFIFYALLRGHGVEYCVVNQCGTAPAALLPYRVSVYRRAGIRVFGLRPVMGEIKRRGGLALLAVYNSRYAQNTCIYVSVILFGTISIRAFGVEYIFDEQVLRDFYTDLRSRCNIPPCRPAYGTLSAFKGLVDVQRPGV
jgi:hypothetical protein